ncbi:hypothetical protein BAUCODRAFT_150233 [Baudoinia panamericana UAMH 10762]|uniref:Uncharacterized protein n=1 Tax=Baudoinia panamericana (strain UAMH 10762) TaxID=717646 RepID=M2LIM2_BAUPA|nr:uncharacterized protein BAUCODRAFT_150233 [Baudoinia panamericana UAMH 10762]EMC94007.1 hypothetical protein BAUCODRAFT_150233 [Baudoinia panamericana UAMH 10762]
MTGVDCLVALYAHQAGAANFLFEDVSKADATDSAVVRQSQLANAHCQDAFQGLWVKQERNCKHFLDEEIGDIERPSKPWTELRSCVRKSELLDNVVLKDFNPSHGSLFLRWDATNDDLVPLAKTQMAAHEVTHRMGSRNPPLSKRSGRGSLDLAVGVQMHVVSEAGGMQVGTWKTLKNISPRPALVALLIPANSMFAKHGISADRQRLVNPILQQHITVFHVPGRWRQRAASSKLTASKKDMDRLKPFSNESSPTRASKQPTTTAIAYGELVRFDANT